MKRAKKPLHPLSGRMVEVCKYGHPGAAHAGLMLHANCTQTGCACERFTWVPPKKVSL